MAGRLPLPPPVSQALIPQARATVCMQEPLRYWGTAVTWPTVPSLFLPASHPVPLPAAAFPGRLAPDTATLPL